MNKIIILLLSLILMSCNKDKSQNEITNNNLVVFDSVNVKEVKLKPSETIVDDWAEIVVFENNF